MTEAIRWNLEHLNAMLGAIEFTIMFFGIIVVIALWDIKDAIKRCHRAPSVEREEGR